MHLKKTLKISKYKIKPLKLKYSIKKRGTKNRKETK